MKTFNGFERFKSFICCSNRKVNFGQNSEIIGLDFCAKMKLCTHPATLADHIIVPFPEIGCVSQKSTYCLLLKKLDLGCASVSNRDQRQEMMVNRAFHNVILIQGVPCRSLNFVFR